jgi:disulfide bond formation protein DsbB
MPCPFESACKKFLSLPNAARIILAASALSLIFAFVMQYGFKYQPCILCLWQRVPYAAAIIFSALALTPNLRHYTPVLLALCALVFFTGFGLAIFHTGVERHWWLGTSGCSITPLHGGTAEDFRTQLLHMAVARCDEISWKFLGLSMANYNVPWSFILGLFSLCAAKKAAR